MTISRRMFVAGAIASVFPVRAARADSSCSVPDWRGVQVCDVGLVVDHVTARQSRQNWCWAACIEIIFAFHGYAVNQRRIVEKLYGGDPDVPAVGPQVIYAINGDWRSDAGESFRAYGEVLWDADYGFGRADAALQAADDLASNNPLICGALGHATVLTGMTFARDRMGQIATLGLVVRDPWPYAPNRRQLSAAEAMNTRFLTRVRVSR